MYKRVRRNIPLSHGRIPVIPAEERDLGGRMGEFTEREFVGLGVL